MLVLLSILASVSILSIRLPLSKAQADLTTQRVLFLDAHCRKNATKQGEAILCFDLNRNNCSAFDGQGKPLAQAVALPPGFRFVAGPGLTADADGMLRVIYGRFGTTESYSIGVTHREGTHWLLVLGLTGQSYRSNDQQLPRQVWQFEHIRSDVGGKGQ